MKYVRLKDPGTMFNNSETGEDISGASAQAMKESPRLSEAIRGGALIELQGEDEANDWNKRRKLTAKAVQSEGDKAATEAAKKVAEKALIERINEATTEIELKSLIPTDAKPEDYSKAVVEAVTVKLSSFRAAEKQAREFEILDKISTAKTREELETILGEDEDASESVTAAYAAKAEELDKAKADAAKAEEAGKGKGKAAK